MDYSTLAWHSTCFLGVYWHCQIYGLSNPDDRLESGLYRNSIIKKITYQNLLFLINGSLQREIKIVNDNVALMIIGVKWLLKNSPKP